MISLALFKREIYSKYVFKRYKTFFETTKACLKINLFFIDLAVNCSSYTYTDFSSRIVVPSISFVYIQRAGTVIYKKTSLFFLSKLFQVP